MRTAAPNHSPRGLSLIELLIVIGVIVVVASMFVPNLRYNQRKGSAIQCVNNLRQVGLAFRDWASDHGGLFPMQVSATNGGSLEWVAAGRAFTHYQVLSNEFETPHLLVCPADERKKPAKTFLTGFDNENLSYFLGVNAIPIQPQMLLAGDRNITDGDVKRRFLELATNAPVSWTDDLHKVRGNICMADGSVQQLSTSRLRQAIVLSGVTNRLAMP